MRYIELYKDQFNNISKTASSAYHTNEFKEYFNLYRFLNAANNTDELIQARIETHVENAKLSPEIMSEIDVCAMNIIMGVKNMIRYLSNAMTSIPEIDIEGVIMIYGDGSIDGHGIIVDEKAYVILDLNVIRQVAGLYNLKTFLLHEMVHPLHYKLSPAFYFSEYTSVEEIYYKRLIAEGIATKLSGDCLNEPIEDVYWFGYLEKTKVDQWIDYCENHRLEISEKLKNCIETNQIDYQLYDQLFSVVDSGNMTNSRLAYYYGTKIVQNLLKKYTARQILELEYSQMLQEAKVYFL